MHLYEQRSGSQPAVGACIRFTGSASCFDIIIVVGLSSLVRSSDFYRCISSFMVDVKRPPELPHLLLLLVHIYHLRVKGISTIARCIFSKLISQKRWAQNPLVVSYLRVIISYRRVDSQHTSHEVFGLMRMPCPFLRIEHYSAFHNVLAILCTVVTSAKK